MWTASVCHFPILSFCKFVCSFAPCSFYFEKRWAAWKLSWQAGESGKAAMKSFCIWATWVLILWTTRVLTIWATQVLTIWATQVFAFGQPEFHNVSLSPSSKTGAFAQSMPPLVPIWIVSLFCAPDPSTYVAFAQKRNAYEKTQERFLGRTKLPEKRPEKILFANKVTKAESQNWRTSS